MKNMKINCFSNRLLLGLFFVFLFGLLLADSALAVPPVVTAVLPASGRSAADQAIVITAVYGDPDGWTDLTDVWILVNTGVSMASALCLRYDRAANKLYLLDNIGANWLGGVTPGTSAMLENSQGRLFCAQTAVSGSGTTLTVTWLISFKPAFAGSPYNIYLWARDNTTAVGWTPRGMWLVEGTPPPLPIVIDDGQYTGNRTQLHARWIHLNSQVAVVEYQYQISQYNAVGPVIVPWTSAGAAMQVTRTGLSLTQGVPYFFSVKARSGVNLWSAVGASDGISFMDVSPPLMRTITPPDGTTYTDGDNIQVRVAVSNPDWDVLQYQFLVDGVVKQPWGSAASWAWNTTGIVREHTVTVQVRDSYPRQVEQSFKLFGCRKPRSSP